MMSVLSIPNRQRGGGATLTAFFIAVLAGLVANILWAFIRKVARHIGSR